MQVKLTSGKMVSIPAFIYYYLLLLIIYYYFFIIIYSFIQLFFFIYIYFSFSHPVSHLSISLSIHLVIFLSKIIIAASMTALTLNILRTFHIVI